MLLDGALQEPQSFSRTLTCEPASLPTVRRANPADVAALSQIENASFSHDRISKTGFQRIVRSPSAFVFICDVAGICAGYAILLTRSNSRQSRLYSIAVHPDFRRQRLGEILLWALEQAASAAGKPSIRLEVRVDNHAAIAFYTTRRYRPIEMLSGYYADGADAYRLTKALTA